MMINFSKLLELAIPVIGTVVTNVLTETTQSVSPIKQENFYNTIVPTTISTITKELVKDENIVDNPIVQQNKLPGSDNISAYDIAKNKKYKQNF